MNHVAKHYDKLIDIDNDPVRDPAPLRDYMDKWDGQEFIDKLQLDKDKSVLEIGVGTGRLAVKVAPKSLRFVGIDISSKTIQRAKENLSNIDNVSFLCDDFMTAKFTKTFDVIYSSLTFMHIKEKQSAISKVYDLLSNDGIFALSIDKNQDDMIDAGVSRISIYPDNPKETEMFIKNSGLVLIEKYETDFAYIFISKK